MFSDVKSIKEDAGKRMEKSIEALKHELSKVRTGRAQTNMLDHVSVDYYGNPTPISQVASLSVVDARTIQVQPWERDMLSKIDRAIRESDLGLNPVSVGDLLRVPLPPLSEERRKEMGKLVRQEGEGGKVAVRNIRRDANNHLKALTKDKTITEDDERRAQEEIQKITDRYIGEVDKIIEAKEKDLMEV